MKKINLIGFAVLLFSLSSCSLNTTVISEEINEDTDEYKIDVIESFIDCKDGDDYRLIEPVNNRMGDIVDSLMYDTKSQAISLFSTLSNRRSKRPAFKYELMTRDTIFTISRKLISARITAYSFSGGAHGRTDFYAVNYRPETGRFLTISEIFDMSKEALIDAAIEKNFKNEKGCFKEKPTMALATTINISKDSAIFTYEHYILGAYYCGSAVVEVPLKEINDYLKL